MLIANNYNLINMNMANVIQLHKQLNCSLKVLQDRPVFIFFCNDQKKKKKKNPVTKVKVQRQMGWFKVKSTKFPHILRSIWVTHIYTIRSLSDLKKHFWYFRACSHMEWETWDEWISVKSLFDVTRFGRQRCCFMKTGEKSRN